EADFPQPEAGLRQRRGEMGAAGLRRRAEYHRRPCHLPRWLVRAGHASLNETIDDLVIFAVLDSIDGPGKILGQAGPCFIRLPGYLPLIGVMRFDTADVANLESAGQFDEVILHEMGHVLGFGTIWGPLGLLADPASAGGTD